MPAKKSDSAFDRQVGGSHYQQDMQPFPFAVMNDFNAFQWSVFKYTMRIPKEDEKKAIEDLDKIIHYCEMYKELIK